MVNEFNLVEIETFFYGIFYQPDNGGIVFPRCS